MCPQSVVAGCDTKASHEVVCKCPYGCLEMERRPVRCNHPVDWKTNNEGNIEPVDVLVPIGLGDGRLGDVRLLWIVLFGTRWCWRWL